VIDVIMNQRFFCLPNGLLNGVELLSQVEARSTFLDHGNDAPQMALRAPQPLHDLRVTPVNDSIHAGIISPRMGSIKPRPRRPLPAECRGVWIGFPLADPIERKDLGYALCRLHWLLRNDTPGSNFHGRIVTPK